MTKIRKLIKFWKQHLEALPAKGEHQGAANQIKRIERAYERHRFKNKKP